jgi:hypothetical protein
MLLNGFVSGHEFIRALQFLHFRGARERGKTRARTNCNLPEGGTKIAQDAGGRGFRMPASWVALKE